MKLELFSREDRFQFLIGTVQRKKNQQFLALAAEMFQFLIGTVQQQYLCGLRNTLLQNIV